MSGVSNSNESALRDNINSKGQNSYYFAHANTSNAPKWDGKEEPRKLTREESLEMESSNNVNNTEETKIKYKTLDYAWSDGNKKVSIYIEFNEIDSVDDDSIVLENTEESIDFKFKNSSNGHHYRILVEPLSEKITAATFKKKSDKFLLLLTKSTELSWSKLKK